MAVDFSAGGYRFMPSVFQYSGGAAALPGHAIERVRFRTPVPLKQGFERSSAHHQSRPPADVVLRLRTALARAVHRAGLSRLQRSLCRDAARSGACSTAR